MVSTITDRLYGESSGVAVKAPVVAISQGAALALNGLVSLGGYAVQPNDRVLVKDQTDPTTNGIYNASTSAWTRAGDFDGPYDAVNGTLVCVVLSSGSSIFYQLEATNPVQIGSSALTFQPFFTAPNQNYPQTTAEAVANVVPVSTQYAPDAGGMLNVFRYFTAAQIADVLAGTATQDVSAAIQLANDFVEGKAVGAIGTLGALAAGAGYNGAAPGTFNLVTLTGGHGQAAVATVTVGAGGAIASITIGYLVAGTWVGSPGSGYQVGDVLTLTSANLVAAGAAAGGGSSCTIHVTALATGGKTGATITPGASLFFPAGRYFCGTTGLRVGDMVRWLGSSVSGTRFTWSSAFNGNRITIGPDASGIDGRSGFYAMGANLERCTVEPTNGTGWGVYTTGLQQNGRIKDVWVQIGTNNNGGVYLQDHFGSANMLCEDTYVFPLASPISATAVGFHCDGGANLVLSRCSCNGAAGSPLLRGIEYINGALTVRDFECELSVTHLDIPATASENAIIVEGAIMNLGTAGSLRGVWIHAGFPGSVALRGIAVGPSEVAIQNDNTNEEKQSPAGGGIISDYVWSGTATDVAVLHNAIVVPPLVQVNPPAVTTLNVESNASFNINVGNNQAFTIAAPTVGSNAMPATAYVGRRILIKIRNVSGVAMGAITWNGVFKLSAFTNPANGNSRSIEFEWNGTNWVQLWQATADAPN